LGILSDYDNTISDECMILSFKNKLAEDIFFDRQGAITKKFPSELYYIAQRKLQYLNAANSLNDLKVPPGNRLELLRGNLQKHYSIRINNRWRVVFRWHEGASDVQVIDYH